MSARAKEAMALLESHTGAEALALFAAYDVEVDMAEDEAPPEESGDVVVAAIGFAGEHLRGSIAVVGGRSSVEHCRGWLAGPDNTADVSDVLGELANMVLGRVKGRLLQNGVTVLMSTPTVARGSDVVIAPRSNRGWITFRGRGFRLTLRVDAEFDERFVFEQTNAEPTASPGDLVLF